MSNDQGSDINNHAGRSAKDGQDTAPNLSDDATGELRGEQLASLREFARPGLTASELLGQASASLEDREAMLEVEGSTKSIERDSLVELLKVEVKETEHTRGRQFGILKHTATRDEERLGRLSDAPEEDTRPGVDADILSRLRPPEEDEDPTTAVPQDMLDRLKESVHDLANSPEHDSDAWLPASEPEDAPLSDALFEDPAPVSLQDDSSEPRKISLGLGLVLVLLLAGAALWVLMRLGNP